MALFKAEGRTNFPEFCDEEGYTLLETSIESVFQPIMEEIKDHRDRSLTDSITSRLDYKENYQCIFSFLRGAENQALDNELDNSVINSVHIGSDLEGSKGNNQGFNILEHYAAGVNTCYLYMSFVKIL